jgi:hypothetical protein
VDKIYIAKRIIYLEYLKNTSADMPENHNIFMASKTFDKLEISGLRPGVGRGS